MFPNIFTKSFTKTLLGRWNRSCEQSTTIKVNWANVDHCGTCSKNDLTAKYEYTLDNTIKMKKLDDELVYYFDSYPEPTKQYTNVIKVNNKKNIYGINYFLTRTMW